MPITKQQLLQILPNAGPVAGVFFAWRKVMTETEKDRDILARTLWGEARGESLAGQIAVAWTIRNRVNDGKAKSWWGEGYVGVCQKPYQFSCWNKNDPNFAYLSGAKAIPFRELAQARIAADQVIDGKVPDPTGGATHYYATTMPKAPAWTAKAKQTLKLGHHVFFKDVP
ncbi:cell wall hydrolase [Pseudomonas helleri]|uniref:cell wall hydrolase n=1 Tax=Pseudomonas helleri TaxID=1608996 RepID=UPI003F9A8B74